MAKKIFALVMSFVLFFTVYFSPGLIYTASVPDIDSGCAILIDARTGQILYNKNMHEKSYPASITKIVTCILALEKGGLGNYFTADNVTVDIGTNSSSIYLSVGETLTVEQLLYGLMLKSGNDAANALAQYVSGSIEKFSELMTQKAADLGASNTNFANANGLHDENHYTTAYDMAMIMKYAITIPEFINIISTVQYEVPATEYYNETRYWRNTHKLLSEKKYDPVVGGKTGWTTPAGNTLVTYAVKDNRELITVVLRGNNSDAVYSDTVNLLEYGFNSFKECYITKDSLSGIEIDVFQNSEKIGTMEVISDGDYCFLIPDNVDESSIVKEFDIPQKIELEADVEACVNIMLPESKTNKMMESKLATINLIPGEIKLIKSETENGEQENNNIFPGAATFNDIVKNLTPLQIICFSTAGVLLLIFFITLVIRKINLAKKKSKIRARDKIRKKAMGWEQ